MILAGSQNFVVWQWLRVGADMSEKVLTSKGRKIAAFTDSEENVVGLSETLPFLLERKLRELGANIQKSGNFEAFAVADGNLITGQNLMSSELVAEKVSSAISLSKT